MGPYNGGKTILIVDDEPSVRQVLERLLTHEGYGVLSAADGKEALRLVKNQRPDMVLLDLMMPGMDGMAVCRRIRANSKTRFMPVIMLTAKGAAADEIKGLEKGADDYVAKPFDIDDVKARVAGLFRRCESVGSSAT